MRRGDGVLIRNVGFGVLLRIGPQSGLVLLQNASMVELELNTLSAGVEAARQFCSFISSRELS